MSDPVRWIEDILPGTVMIVAVEDAGEVAAIYFRTWLGKDFAMLRSVLADDVTFRGPLGTADNAESCLRGLRAMAEIMTDIGIEHRWVDGPDVLTWFELHTTLAAPCATVNWSHIEDGKVKAIRVTFDARELAAALGR